MSISLPPAVVREFERVRKAENPTRSELVHEALRTYFDSRFPAVEPTKAELAAIRRGRTAFQRGDSVTLEHLNDLAPAGRRASTKRSPKVAGKRSGAR